MASIVCISCNFTISVDSKFCAFWGVPIDSLDSLVTQYFKKGFQYESIVQLLEKFNFINISLRTLKSKFRDLNLKRRSVYVDFDLIRWAWVGTEQSGTPSTVKGFKFLVGTCATPCERFGP